MAGVPKNRSLQAKTAARLAAVQLAYRVHIRGGVMAPETLMREYATFRDEEAAIKGEAPNKALLTRLLTGLEQHGEALKKAVEEQLKANWSVARTNPILFAILELAVFELDSERGTKKEVIIDEYTNIAAKLLEQSEVGFVHAALKEFSKKLRE
jgi:transcription antitermination factor NusB